MFLDFSKPDDDNCNLHLLPGEADFVVMRAIDKPSGNGREMIRIDVVVTDMARNKGTIKVNFIVEEILRWKIKEFLVAIGDFQSVKREIDIDMFLKKRGRCILELKKGAQKEGLNEWYKDKIEIKSFIAAQQYNNSPAQDAASQLSKQRHATSVKTKQDNLEEPNDDLGAAWYPEDQK